MPGFEEYAEYGAAIAGIYEHAEQELMAAVARRVARGIKQPGWADQKLAEIRHLQNETRSILDKIAAGAGDLLAQGVERSFYAGNPPIFQSPIQIRTNQQAIAALIQDARRKLNDTHVQILRKAEDGYRTIIADTVAGAVVGSRTRAQAAQRALERFADAGIDSFTDKSGRRWEMAAYADMATRTTLAHANIQGNIARYTSDGYDLVIVSVSPEPCPICDPYEGKIFSLSGASDRYPHLNKAIGGGLFHSNCTHRITPYIPGLTRPLTPAEKYNKRGENKYQERQQQRAIERNIRKWKRRSAASIDPVERERANQRVRAYQKRMREFINDTGRIRQRRRESMGINVTPRNDGFSLLPPKSNIDPRILSPTVPRGAPVDILEKWATTKWPGKEFDFTGIDAAAMGEALQRLDELAAEWPGVMDRLQHFGRRGPSSKYPFDWGEHPNAFAHATLRGGEVLGLNPDKWRDVTDLNRRLALCRATGFTVSGDIATLITHEWGHLVDGWLRAQRTMAITQAVGADGAGLVKDTWLKWRKKSPRAGPSVLSRYSTTNTDEKIAEGFAALYHGLPNGKKPGAYIKALKQVLQILHPARWRSDAPVTLDQLHGPERERAIEELSELRRILGLDK